MSLTAKAPTILLVEDNEDNRRIYATILAHAGYRVLEATDGEAGITMAEQHLPEMILMDVSIPKASRARHRGRLSRCP